MSDTWICKKCKKKFWLFTRRWCNLNQNGEDCFFFLQETNLSKIPVVVGVGADVVVCVGTGEIKGKRYNCKLFNYPVFRTDNRSQIIARKRA